VERRNHGFHNHGFTLANGIDPAGAGPHRLAPLPTAFIDPS